MCGHSSGAIGFPLRLLAREVYDRVVRLKGEKAVALITGEERIEPKDARWLLCTAEAMPATTQRGGKDLAFVALDEAQLAADPERGHIFTDRLLNARGREETMILGSATLEPMIKALAPEAERRMSTWLADPENAVDRFGRYPYSYEAFGLDRDWVEELFADYSRYFGLD